MSAEVALEADLADQTDIIVNRTAHFVVEWIQDHATATQSIPAYVAAEALANECIADAERRGILLDEINDEVGDLKEYLAETVLGATLPPAAPKD